MSDAVNPGSLLHSKQPKPRLRLQEGKGMSEHKRVSLDQPAIYEIQVQGMISESWVDYFDDLQMTVVGKDGWAVTTLAGQVIDQAALQGLLQKLYTLGLVLLHVVRKENIP